MSDRAAARALPIVFHARDGLEGILCAELSEVLPSSDPHVSSPGRVRALFRLPLRELFRARTWYRVAFPLPQQWVKDGEDEAAAIVRAVTSEEARAVFDAFTAGRVRYRVAFAEGGHKRALVWRVAKEVSARAPELVNNPTQSLWELLVRVRGRFVDVEATPRALTDPRFAYRLADVPAASHPTIAAALARVAGAAKDDVVWDPFCGSGTELVERARFGPYARLLGTDRSPEALEAARKNLVAAGLEDVELARADATTFSPRARPTLIVTNPPMGRRVARGDDLRAILDGFVDHLAEVLAPGGRLVWISPFPERTRARLLRRGLDVDLEETIDMGGFPARMQRAYKR